MVTFIVVISSGLRASQESHGQHSGFWTCPVPSLCMASCPQCGYSLFLLPGLLEGTAPHHSSPSLRQEVRGVALLALPKPHPPETACLPHPDPHPSLPTSTLFLRVPLCLLLTVLWTAVLKKHLVWLVEVEDGSRSCQLNCRSHMPAIRGCLLYKSHRPRPPLGFSPLPSQLWSQPTL